ncbi:MAG TPA: LarC family nickel insertion protein [Actinomycetota bacterium]|nr:LarC family nickel insertion protein [Actinomycetota bacterium]
MWATRGTVLPGRGRNADTDDRSSSTGASPTEAGAGTVAYFDCFSGISGAMVLGALVHAGADLDAIAARLQALAGQGFALEPETVELHGLVATRVHLRARPQGVIRTYASIRRLLDRADLPEAARQAAHRVFRRLAEAEATVHGKDLDFVTLHEFGDLEALVEVVGAALALHELGVERVFASPVPTGMGMIRTEHGMKPVPSPEVAELLRHVPTFSRGIPVELATPTGAAIVAALSEGYGDMPLMRPTRVGYGAGDPRPDFPHVLRVVLGELEPSTRPRPPVPPAVEGSAEGEAYLLEALLCGSAAQGWPSVARRAVEAGARSAWAVWATLADGADAVLVSAVVPAERRSDVQEALLREPGLEELRVAPVRVLRPGPVRPEGLLA